MWLENKNPGKIYEYPDALRHTYNRVYCDYHFKTVRSLFCIRRFGHACSIICRRSMMRAWDVVIASQRIRSAIDFARGELSSINSVKRRRVRYGISSLQHM